MRSTHVCVAGLFALWLTVFPSSLNAEAGGCEQWIAKVVSVQGTVEARRGGGDAWEGVRLNDTLCLGDALRVGRLSRAEVLLANDATLRLDQKTTVNFNARDSEGGILTRLFSGVIHFFSRFPRSLKVVTPSVNAAVKGTECLIAAEGDETVVTVFEGEMYLENDAGVIGIGAGQTAVAVTGQPPGLRDLARPRDGVQWALYYPPVISYCPDRADVRGVPDRDRAIRQSLQHYCTGDLSEAFESLSPLREDRDDGWLLTYRATLLLSVGRVDEARRDLDRAIELDGGSGAALALQSMIATVHHDRERAVELGRRAAASAPGSAAALISLSYALQSRFELQAAVAVMRDAVSADPGNALAWARLAELSQSLSLLDEALDAAGRAASIDPGLSRTQTVLGFARLTRLEADASKAPFEKAAGLDQADPLPRLGLGLAKVRQGDLSGGRGDIEVAAALDPDNSLTRSYLGKAYYEEKRDEKAAAQFKAAQELDPFDPTPWFYSAILKQTLNRPVEALEDLQKAISLNDNRAVYRSRLMLDSDLAARSASLGRVYADLGFQQRALAEGWRSVSADPGDYSAHRFLADSYAALPRHEISRVSELLQSQLLQPLNITPVQPSLAEPNLFILTGAGPSVMSFNEFNPLFLRDRLAFQISGITGDQSTFGDEMALSGVRGPVSFSLGQFHYETDGFRPNNDQRQDVYNAYLQVSLTPATSVQAEFRARDMDKGDLELRFDPDNFLPDMRQKERTRYGRLGLRHSFGPGSDLLVSAVYQDFKGDLNLTNPSGFGETRIAGEERQKGLLAEAQYLLRPGVHSMVVGGGYFGADRENSTDILFVPGPDGPPVPPISTTEASDEELRHANMYLYANLSPSPALTLVIGASGDFFQGSLTERDQFNPKAGVIWSPLAGMTVRGAVFRTLTRSLINSQTIEPTQVAGFSQFYDDADGAEAWCYGAAVDQRFTGTLSGGVEYRQRDLKVPFQDITFLSPDAPPTVQVLRVDWKERNGRAYLYWAPHRWVALSAEYHYERFDRGQDFNAGVEQVTTRRFPLGAGFFHPSGLGARVRVMYVDQDGVFLAQGSALGAEALPGSSSFWTVDATLSYRLPKRYGMVVLGAKNLFDESFRYQDMDPLNPSLQPKRLVYARVTLAF